MCDFNPRSPCGERLGMGLSTLTGAVFQSMLPVRGATRRAFTHRRLAKFQSRLPVRGATSPSRKRWSAWRDFNPCSPCGERRQTVSRSSLMLRFQSMLPVRGATKAPLRVHGQNGISIHAPRAGSDLEVGIAQAAAGISIHAPRAGSDQAARYHGLRHFISIHAPRAGSD